MIVRMHTGKSFHGAALYYFHDKRAKHELLRLSDERVAWTHTHNCASNVPELAIQEMIAVAQHQTELKRVSGQRLSGRPLEEPVMTIALSWHPDTKHRPDKEHMIGAANDFLRRMGWHEHQAVMLSHTDTRHPHLHIIMNRVHPFTGLVHDDRNGFHRAQRWRLAYNREHAHEFQPKQRGHVPYEHAISIRDGAERFAKLEATANRTEQQIEKDQLALVQKHEREAFLDTAKDQFRLARERAYKQVREDFRHRWTAHFATPDRAAAKLHRKAMRHEQHEQTRLRQDEACLQLYGARADEFTTIKQRQKKDRAEFKALQAARAAGQPYDQRRLGQLLNGQSAPPRDLATAQHLPALQPHRELFRGPEPLHPAEHARAREERGLAPTVPAKETTDHEAARPNEMQERIRAYFRENAERIRSEEMARNTRTRPDKER